MNTAMTTQNLGNRPPTSGAEGGEVVRPQNSEFQTLKLRIKEELKDVEVEEKEDKIIVRKGELEIAIENWGEDYDYWVWRVIATTERGSGFIYISSSEQSLEIRAETSKNTKLEMNVRINSKDVEQDLYICTDHSYAIDEIKDILEEYEEHGIFGMYLYFCDYLEPELSFLEP